MTRMLLILFVAVPFGAAHSQDQRVIDSVTSLIKNDGSRSDMEIFYELGFQYAKADYSLSVEYLNKGLPIADKLGDSLMSVKFRRMSGQVLQFAGRQQQALEMLESALAKADTFGFEMEVGHILTMLGITHSHMAHYDKGQERNFQALKHWTALNDSIQIADVLNNIGFVHYKVGNFDAALDYFSRAQRIAQRNGFKRVALMSSNIGTAYLMLNDWNKALQWIERSNEACSPGCALELVITNEFSLGYVAYLQARLETAKPHFDKSYQLAVEVANTRFQAENLNYLGEILRKERQTTEALKRLRQAQRICISSDYRDLLAKNYYQFYELYKEVKQTDSAHAFLERYIILDQQVHSSIVRNKIAVMQLEFDQMQHSSEIAHREELLSKQRTQMLLTTMVCILSLAIAIGLYVGFVRKRRSNRLLDQRVTERTRELEANKIELERAYLEQSRLVAKTSQSIRSVLATQKGLYASFVSRGADSTNNSEAIEDKLNTLMDQLRYSTRKSDENHEKNFGTDR